MDENVDLKTGYKVPDGYFQDFALRMSEMASQCVVTSKKRNVHRIIFSVASSVAAIAVLLFGIFHYSKLQNPFDKISKLSYDEVLVSYFGATENDVVNYYYLVSDNNSDITFSNDDIINYVSGDINVFALLENY